MSTDKITADKPGCRYGALLGGTSYINKRLLQVFLLLYISSSHSELRA